jgi:microcystin-dependent protein
MMDAFIGTIMIFGGNFAPRDWAFCNGQLLQIQQYTALYSLLGTTYGGDGRSTFALPKLDSPVAGAHYIICLNGVYPSRS